jgi:hypothetical protein
MRIASRSWILLRRDQANADRARSPAWSGERQVRPERPQVSGGELSGGFKVDLGALVQAAGGVNGTITDVQNNKASDIGGSGADYGGDELAATVSGFCARWEIGVENLANDAREVATRLYLSAANYANYARAEKTVIAHLAGILQSRTGTDPAASQW